MAKSKRSLNTIYIFFVNVPPIGRLTVYEIYGKSASEHTLGPGDILVGRSIFAASQPEAAMVCPRTNRPELRGPSGLLPLELASRAVVAEDCSEPISQTLTICNKNLRNLN